MTQHLVETFYANIYCGLKEGYDGPCSTVEDVKNFLQPIVDSTKFCVTITPTYFLYVDGQEPGVIVGMINYPRYPKTNDEIRNQAVFLASLLKNRFKQERISIVTPTVTMMLGEK